MSSETNYTGELTISTQVADLDKAIAWYGRTLGCSLIYKVDHLGWAEVTSPVQHVSIGLSQVERPKTGAGPVPVWSVADIEKARARLEAMDVRFDGDTVVIPDMVKLATFFDPDGNAWMLAESLQKGA